MCMDSSFSLEVVKSLAVVVVAVAVAVAAIIVATVAIAAKVVNYDVNLIPTMQSLSYTKKLMES